MRRIKVVLAVATAMALMLVASVSPAMAKDRNHNDRHGDGFDRVLVHDNDFVDFDNDDDDFVVFVDDFDNEFVDCPFADDFQGSINVLDCFD